jgi:very-short-patch-repair endonuclease
MTASRSKRFPASDTLVAIIPQPRDFAIAERDSWYRIPCRTAPEMLAHARWLAFYHPASFGAYKWAVHFFAPIEGVDRVTRRDLLPDEPDHPRAREPYFRVRLGPLRKLDRPVPSARARRIVFIPTTLAKLQTAQEINDLYHESPLEDQLWQALRVANIPAERQFYVAEGRANYCLDFAVLCAQASLDVECDGDSWHLRPNAVVEDNARNNALARLGWLVLRFSTRELQEPNIGKVVKTIQDASERLGGIELPGRRNLRRAPKGAVVEQFRLW